MKLDLEDHDEPDDDNIDWDSPALPDPNASVERLNAGVHLILAVGVLMFFAWLAAKLGGPMP